jgi:tetratricopeptide (TPR) repeat protein
MPGDERRPEEVETAAAADAAAPTIAEAGRTTAPHASDAAGLPLVSPEVYRLEGEIGRGGMGRIVSATDTRLGRPVAIKELHRDLTGGATRFVREALVTARLQHPSIVPVYEAGRWPDGVPFYAMKMVSGQSLSVLIRSGHTLAARLALLPHVIAVAEAIAYAHSQRIIHRDLKPANILVGPFGETVVVDWGLAKDLARPSEEPSTPAGALRAAGASADSTVVGTVLGTPHFMPPEQARGEAVDERADVYALGAILYYLLRGEPPHSGKTANEALAAVVSGAPEPVESHVPDAPHELCAIVRKAMSPAREERYPTAGELAADLRRFETGQLVTVHAYSTRELLARWVRRNRMAVLVGGALGLGLAISLALGVAGIRREARRAEAERDRARLETQKAEAINAFVQDMLGSADPLEGSKDVTVAEVLDRAAQRAASELRKEPEIQAAVQLTIAHSEIGLGRLDKAEALAREALATRRRVLGPRSRDVARALVEVGGALDQKGQFQEAATLFSQALEILDGLGLGATLDAANVKNDLASAYQYLGRNRDAERLHREVLAQKRALLDSDDPSLAESLNNLGVVVGQRGQWAEAEKLHREALAIMRKAHGSEHVEVAAAMRTLAAVLEARKKFAEAEPLYKEALAQCTKLLGPTHPDTAWTLYNYAFMLRLEGKPSEAAARARQVLALRGKTLPDTHPMIAASQQVLGSSLLDMGRPEAAEPLLRDSLALRRSALPKGHWLIAVSESVLGGCLTRLGRFSQAEPLLVSGYESLRSNPAVEKEKIDEARARLAALYEAWHKPGKAASLKGAAS